jgi:hypothetical protein
MANTATVTVLVPPAVRGWDANPPDAGPGEVVISEAGNDPVHYPVSKDGTVTVPAPAVARFLVLIPGAAAVEEASS